MASSRTQLSRSDTATRISAYVYGNLLVLAALISQTPADASSGRACVVVLATGLTTYLAHTFAEALGERIRYDVPPTAHMIIHELRNALPILTSTAIPALVLATSWWGWLPATVGLALAQAVTVVRMGFLGVVLGRLRRQRASLRSLWTGILLAAGCAGIAILKADLLH